MKKKLGIRALAVMLAASVVMSASSGMVSAKSYGASVSSTGDVSDTSSTTETTSRSSAGVSIEGSKLNVVKAPTGLAGEGTVSDPYQIGSLNDLLLMNTYINYEGSSQKNFVLTQDVDLSGVKYSHFSSFDGIIALVSAKASLSGNGNVYFRLNGNGHKLFGLNAPIAKGAVNAAVFGYVNANSVLENIKLESCTLRVNNPTDGAYALLAVQNHGTIRDCVLTDCVLDLRLAPVASASAKEGYLSTLPCGRVYIGHALGVADNVGKVQNFTVTGSDTNKGIFTKGGRRYVGVVAGQNRGEIDAAAVSGVRIVSYGSDDSDTSVSGKGTVSVYVGGVAGSNDKSASINNAKVELKYGSDILFGDVVGGIAGENSGEIRGSAAIGTVASTGAASASSANLYGCGVYGGLVGSNNGAVISSGAYNIGFCFAGNDVKNVYGGISGALLGSVSDSVSSGNVNLRSCASASVGGLAGSVQAGATMSDNYTFVSVSQAGANVGAVFGKDGSSSFVGKNNYWSSYASGLTAGGSPANDLTAATPVIVLPKSTSGTTLHAADLAFAWSGSKATAAADFTKAFTIDNKAIRVSKSASSVTLSSSADGAMGELSYRVTVSVPAGVSGQKFSVPVRIPVFVTASATTGAGASVRNPIVISSASQMQIMQYAPGAHYRLAADITLGSSWTPVAFTGTLDGAGHTLRVEKPLFSSVTGSRNGSVSDPAWKSSGSNLIQGYIYELNIVPATCVSGGVFGDVSNATLRDVCYKVNSDNDGFVALSAPKSGALIDTISGNVFLYRCSVSVPVAVTASEADGIGALVGYVSASNLVADSCETTALLSLEKNISNVGGLFGNIASVSGTAELTNCRATGCVYVPSTNSSVKANIMIGAAASGVSATGCKYDVPAAVSGGSVSKTAAPFTKGISKIQTDSAEKAQSTEDVRSMLSLIDPEMIDDVEEITSLTPVNGVYEIHTKSDLEDMRDMIAADTAGTGDRAAEYVLCADIDMGGDTFGMATTGATAFKGIFRGATPSGGGKYTISNFVIPAKSAYDSDNPETAYTNATGLFAYAVGATFSNFAIEDASVTSPGMGTAILVGFADNEGSSTGSTATQCSFDNIEISGCTVNSTRPSEGTQYTLINTAQAGTLIGCAWSTAGSAGTSVYTITNILVKDCTVQNTVMASSGSSGSYAIGGLIGESRVSPANLHIGASGASTSVVLEHVTVTGYGHVAGVVGRAGIATGTYQTPPPTQPGPGTGGLLVERTVVRRNENGRSVITAGNGSGNGGVVGGIVACVTGAQQSATIRNCTVSDTDVISDNNIPGTTSAYGSNCGGIAGMMAGTIDSCTVNNCMISSCTPGGIIGRSSRYAATNIGTLTTIENCNVIGETLITVPSTFTGGTYHNAGGIMAEARTSSAVINNCGVGSKVKISGAFNYAGGILGWANGAAATYPVLIENCVMAGTVENLTDQSNSVVAGAVGNLTTAAQVKVLNCYLGGAVNNKNWYAGGAVGQVRFATAYSGANYMLKNCVIAAELNKDPAATWDADNHRLGKVVAYVSVNYSTSGWMLGTDGGTKMRAAFVSNVLSTYPQESVEYFGSIGGTPASFYSKYNAANLQTVVINTFHDVNKPDGTHYINGRTDAYPIDGSVSTTASITLQSAYQTTYTGASSLPKLSYYDHDDSTTKTYGGWSSSAAGYLVVTDNSTAGTIEMTAKKEGSAYVFGGYGMYQIDVSTGNATSTLLVDPETSVPAVICAGFEVSIINVASAGLEGQGTSSEPFQITSVEDLDTMRTLDLSTTTHYYQLMNDIEFTPSMFQAGGDFVGGFPPITGTNQDGAFHAHLVGDGYSISGLQISGSDAYTGLFAKATDAHFDGVTLEDSDISTSGTYGGGLVGYATHTYFTDTTISGVTVSGSAYAGALAAYAVDTNTSGTELSDVTVEDAHFTGGLFGHAHYSGTSGNVNVISNTTINGLSVTSSGTLDVNVSYDGVSSHKNKVDAAGGLVAEFAGTINPTGTTTIEGTVEIHGTIAGGAIGIVDQTYDAATVACTINNVTIGGGENDSILITSTRTLNEKAAAGGMVGKIRTQDTENGGSIPPVALTVSHCKITSDATVSAVLCAGGILGSSSMADSSGSVSLTYDESYATVAFVTTSSNTNGVLGGIVGRAYVLKLVSVDHCVAGGSVSMNNSLGTNTVVGGVIGLGERGITSGEGANPMPVANGTTLISNTVVSASIDESAATYGNVIGSVDSTTLPSGISPSPFGYIYYSSYMFPNPNNPIPFCGDNACTGYTSTYRDLQTEFKYMDNSKSLPLSQSGLTLSSGSILIPYGGTGSFISFTCDTSVPFVLDTIYPVSSVSNLFTYNKTTQHLTLGNSGAGKAVFRYENGIEVSLNVIAFAITGDGSVGSPYLIERIEHFEVLKEYPSANFILARDIDFTVRDLDGSNNPTSNDGPAWADAWNSWAASLTTTPFTGSLSGMYYPYSGSSYNTSAAMVEHTISGLNVTSNRTSIGFLPTIASTGSVTHIKFSDCSFTYNAGQGNPAASANVGVLAGENSGTVTYVTVAGSSATGTNHVGAIAGVSYATIDHCYVDSTTSTVTEGGTTTTVTNRTSVSSSHCAGGIVGGGIGATNCTVNATDVNGTDLAGGICGGTLSFVNEVSSSLRSQMSSNAFTDCSVTDSTISTRQFGVSTDIGSSATSAAGGILGEGETGQLTSTLGGASMYRNLTIARCTVDAETVVNAFANTSDTDEQYNYAGGILGHLSHNYDGFVVQSCDSSATVSAYGDTADNTAAGAIVGAVGGSAYFKPYNSTSGAPAFKIINNVCRGTVRSARYAGGVCGYIMANPGSDNDKISGGDFICGNLISSRFANLPTNHSVASGSSTYVGVGSFGIFIGFLGRNTFTSAYQASAAGSMTANYYTSYVCNDGDGNDSIKVIPTTSQITSANVYDIAKRSKYVLDENTNQLVRDPSGAKESSYTVKNQYLDGNNVVWSDYEAILIGANYNSSASYPATYSKPTRFMFDVGNGDSADFGLPATSLVVYSGVPAGEQHTLALGTLTIDPSVPAYYTVSKTTSDSRYQTTLAIAQDPTECPENPVVIASLGYGLIAGLKISKNNTGATEDGSFENPYLIPTATVFAKYFFSSWANSHPYLTSYYRQTRDIDFDDIVIAISALSGHSPRQDHFSPIGTDSHSFAGGYDGGGHVISDFYYTANSNEEDGDQDVGLFGYINDRANASETYTYRIRNLHIELKESDLDSDTIATESGSTKSSGVSGGKYTGGLVGRYESAKTISNCSVVYGSVWSDADGSLANDGVERTAVGGLIGRMNAVTLTNCFTSTNVRVKVNSTLSSNDVVKYAAGGLVGHQMTGGSNNRTTYEYCFSSSDVLGQLYVGGFVGRVYDACYTTVSNCSCTATVTGLAQLRSSGSSAGTAIMIGYRDGPDGATYNCYPYVTANNVFIGGMNATEFSHRGNAGNSQEYYPVLFGLATLQSGSSDIFYDASTLGRISVPQGVNVSPKQIKVTGEYFNGAGTTQESGVPPFTAKSTDDLISSSFDGLVMTREETVVTDGNTSTVNMDIWDVSDDSLYPVIQMKRSPGETADNYYGVFAKLSAVPVLTDSREADDVTMDRTLPGVTYPTRIMATFGSAAGAPALTINSSKYSAATDTLAYDGTNAVGTIDHKLVGNGATRSSSDMHTDFLFNMEDDDDYTFILRNSYLNTSVTGGVPRNEKTPYVRVATSVTVGGKTYTPHRNIRIGLLGDDDSVYVATERQLRALSSPEASGKFSTAYDGYEEMNIWLCADIDFLPEDNNLGEGGADLPRVGFEPIQSYQVSENAGSSYVGSFGFDGSNCEIRNLYIAHGSNYLNPVGLFESFEDGGKPKINNLILRDPDIAGCDFVGALVGQISNEDAEINNCMVIGGSVKGKLHVGGIAGQINGTSDSVTKCRVEKSAVVGTVVTNVDANPDPNLTETRFGLLVGDATRVTFANDYAIGELKADAVYVGGLVGLCYNCTLSGIVTSGYVENSSANESAAVGGVIGRELSNVNLRNAESTAFVKGTVSTTKVGGIVGDSAGGTLSNNIISTSSTGGTISKVIFAGGIYSDGTAKNVICPQGGNATITNAAYDKQLQFSTYSPYTAMKTLEIVKGSGKIGGAKLHDGTSGLFDATDTLIAESRPDGILTQRGLSVKWSFDKTGNGKYYPSPITVKDESREFGAIGHEITDEFLTGLQFALARINLTYGGGYGDVSAYNMITVTSPIGIMKQTDTDSFEYNQKTGDSVALTELGDIRSGNSTMYLEHPNVSATSSLRPVNYSPDAKTAIRASLNSGTDGTTFDTETANSIYRYLIVNVVRVVEVDYVINDTSSLLGGGNNSAVLMISTGSSSTTFTSNAVTSKFQDAETSSGSYTVKFDRILVPDNKIYPTTLLPDGCKATYSLSNATSPYVYSGRMSNDGTYIDLSNIANTSSVVHVKLIVTIEKDVNWGLHDRSGGLTNQRNLYS